MKDQELELQVAPMSNDTMEYLNVLFGVCKRFKTDYYHATPKQREFIYLQMRQKTNVLLQHMTEILFMMNLQK